MSSSETLPSNVLYAASMSLAATTSVAGASWGIMTVFYSVCMYGLIRNIRSAKATRKTTVLAVWITVLWTLATLTTLGNAVSYIYAYSWKTSYPGGPTSYLAGIWNEPVPSMTVTTYILTIWFADGMMLWRLFVFYHGIRNVTRSFILFFALLVYVGTLGTGCAVLALTSFDETMYSAYARKFSIPCITLSVVLKILTTASISTRLILFKKTMEKTLGLFPLLKRDTKFLTDNRGVGRPGREGARVSPYTSTTAMLIESAALYAIWSLTLIVVYAMNSPGQSIMIATLCHVEVISPVMIVYRVSKGLGWEQTTSDKLTVMSQMAFAEHQPEADSDVGLEAGERKGMNPPHV